MPVHIIDQLEKKELFPGFTARISSLEQMMFSHWTIARGSKLPEHHHENEQISILIEGRFEFVLEGVKHQIEPGMVVMIPSNARHSGFAATACKIIDIFCPVRSDYQQLMKD